VKDPFSYAPTVQAAGSFENIAFDNPDGGFVWNGTDNILVDICTGPSNPYASPYGGVRSDAMTSGSRFVRADGSGSQCGVNTGSTNSNRPQIQFTYLPPPPCEGTPDAAVVSSDAAALCAGCAYNRSATGVNASGIT